MDFETEILRRQSHVTFNLNTNENNKNNNNSNLNNKTRKFSDTIKQSVTSKSPFSPPLPTVESGWQYVE
jgi:hypothetical protein